MRADAVGRVFAVANQALLFKPVDAEHAAPGIASVVLGGVEPVATGMEHAVAVEMPIIRSCQNLQQTAVAGVDQVALAAGAAPDEHCPGQIGMSRSEERRVGKGGSTGTSAA